MVERVADTSTVPESVLTRPTTVNALDRVNTAPYILAVVLAALTIAALMQTLVASVRERRYDLAVLRALGVDRRQLRGIVHWQAMTVAIIGLVIGVPLGAVVGGRVFRLVANDVGVVPTPLISPLLLGLYVVAALVGANVVASWPAWRAARANVAVLRRS
jgi:ABC-type lipoprotein release transport system permease subunit